MAAACADDYDAFREEFYGSKAVSPNALRGQIRRFLQTTGMKVGEFLSLIGVAAAPYGRFMNGKYKEQWRATENQTYSAAAYFMFREKKLGKHSVGKRLQATAPAKSPVPDISAVELEDYEIYLTPIEVRKGLTQVQKDYDCNNTQVCLSLALSLRSLIFCLRLCLRASSARARGRRAERQRCLTVHVRGR